MSVGFQAMNAEMVDHEPEGFDSLAASDLSQLQSLPPSAKFVYKTIDSNPPIDQQAIMHRTLLPERTVQNALQVLLEEGFIEEFSGVTDARRRFYRTT